MPAALDLADPTVLRMAASLARQAGMEPAEYLALAKLRLIAWRARAGAWARVGGAWWRVGVARDVGGVRFRCVLGQGPTVREALDEARRWLPAAGA
jgi:hypothetical protein